MAGDVKHRVIGRKPERYRQLRFLAGLEELEGTGVAHPLRVHGFEREGRSFGGATAFLAMISKKGENWCKCAILFPISRGTPKLRRLSHPPFYGNCCL